MEITSQSKLFDVLEAYPVLEAQIVNIAPPFQNLKNPVLRRTVGKIATLEKVAQIGGMDVGKLVNTLRRAVGQEELGAEATANFAVEIPRLADAPEWIAGEPQFTLNGTEMLQRGEVPLGRVNELLGQIEPGRFILLVTNFEPTPIIEAMQKQNRQVFHKAHPNSASEWLTFIL
ncbi:MAG: DUF1858 domain-containing protein [Chloroflexi bacterium]|nr:DUF1858 domain-containing protein [Chloroflexota bacterium]